MAVPMVVGGAVAAGAAGAAVVKTGLFAAIGAGILAGLKAVSGFITRNAGKIGHGVAIGASTLSQSTFETKNKRVTFKGGAPVNIGGFAFNLPAPQVTNIRNTTYKQSNSSKAYKKQSGSSKAYKKRNK